VDRGRGTPQKFSYSFGPYNSRSQPRWNRSGSTPTALRMAFCGGFSPTFDMK
jgi:hypothetical protein